MSKNAKIAAWIIGLLLSAVLVFLAFLVFQGRFGRAAGGDPEDMTVTVAGTIENPKAIITWRTEKAVVSKICYGSSPSSTNLIAENSEETTAHSVELVGLAPGTTYYFVECSQDRPKDNAGAPWIFTTKPAESQPESVVLSPTPSPTAAPKKAEPTATPAAVVPTIDEDAVGKAIREEYKTWDIKCAKEYSSAGLCAKYMPRE